MSSTIIPSAKPPVKHMPDRADPGTAALLVRLGGEAPQPADDGLVRSRAKAVNSLATQRLGQRADGVADAHRPPGRAEQRRHAHAEPGVDDSLRELDDLRVQTGDLVDHDHRGTGAARVHRTGEAVVRERRLDEAGKLDAHGVETLRASHPENEEQQCPTDNDGIEEVEVVTAAVGDDGTVVVDDLKALVDEDGNVLATDETIAVEGPDGTVVIDEVISVADEDGELVAIEEDIVVIEED